MGKAKPAIEAKPAADAAPKLLSGGNPQIVKGYEDGPVQAYIAAMPGWKSAMGAQIDAIVTSTVPGLAKAVKWNSPMYGVDGQTWFMGLHVFANYVKVAFFRGSLLEPVPPGTSKQPEVRYLDIRENDVLDEALFAEWVRQASRLPGTRM